MKRIRSIDITRGVVMVIMALDHVRDFIHITSMSQNPLDLQTTTTLLFFTRWVTHICAPTFVLLSGVSAFISFRRQNNLSESRRFLLTRGLWLVFLELTFVTFALWFDIHFRLLLLEVISAIGFSFIILSFLLKLPSRVIGLIGIFIVFSHNLLQGISFPANQISVILSSVLFRPNLMPISNDLAFYSAYPIIPWLGILLIGFGCGEFFKLPGEKRKKLFLKIGLSVLMLFAVIRFINIYGDPSKWASQKSSMFTFLSFINLTKYPPSLLFTLMFIGVAFLILYLSEDVKNRFTEILEAFGRVPLFYFIIHLYIIHSLMFIILIIQGYSWSDFVFGLFKNGRPTTGGGVGLLWIYLIWIGVVVILYPLCKYYGNYKGAHPENIFLRYL
ncbi:MAG: heparan-alpha-glucosaminide N-acetyltransferase domain-containing protein [Bacteroidales bacterium]